MTTSSQDPHGAALARLAEVLGADHGGHPAAVAPTVALDEVSLAISAVLQPHLDIERWTAALDELADGCPAATRDAVADHLFGSGRLQGDRDTYASWRNSCLDQVVDRGRGLPITLSVVAIEVARRIDVPLVGVGMPAHFLVGDPHDPDWFLDAFNGGSILDRDGCRATFTAIAGDDSHWDPAYLDPTPPRAIVVRMLNNLKAGFTRQGDRIRLALVMRMRMLMPEFSSERHEATRALAVLN